jgi:hypothetical protein
MRLMRFDAQGNKDHSGELVRSCQCFYSSASRLHHMDHVDQVFPVRDIHGKETSLSPDGLWRATWLITGCSYFQIIGDDPIWHSKITVSKTTRPAKPSALMFESDSAGNVTFTWPGRNALHIEIPGAANITRSERSVPGLLVTYGVPAGVLRDLAKRLKEDDRQIVRLRKKAISGATSASLADRWLTNTNRHKC